MRTLTLFFTLLFSVSLSVGQTSQQNRSADSPAQYFNIKSTNGDVGDFTVVDSDGTEWNLHTMLESGTTVILDLFQAT